LEVYKKEHKKPQTFAERLSSPPLQSDYLPELVSGLKPINIYTLFQIEQVSISIVQVISHHQLSLSPSLKFLVLFLLMAVAGALPLHESEAVEIRDFDMVAVDLLPRETVSNNSGVTVFI
jgi:hypothetical protein